MPLQRLTTRNTPKPTQAAARYTAAGGAERCGMCRHFAAPSACSRILGPVTARGWCMYFGRLALAPDHAGVQSFLGIPPGASLDLSFMTPGTLDPRVVFTRAAGPATYFNSSGVMQAAATNLAPSSGNLANSSVWGVSGLVMTGSLSGAPDGTATVARMAETSATALHDLVLAVPGLLASTAYTVSIYIKAAERTNFQISLDDSTAGLNGGYATFDVQAGVISQALTARGTGVIGTAGIQPAGNGFFRCWITTTIGANTSARLLFLLSTTGTPGFAPSYAGNPAKGLLVWGAQVEQGMAPSFYIPTTTAPNGAPRWDYDPVTLALKGLLIEEARTNLWLQSADASNAAWVPVGVVIAAPTVTGNQTVAPDGTTTAASVVYPAVATTNNASEVYQSITVGTAAYTMSVWLRGNVGGEQVYLLTTRDTSLYYRTRVTLTTAWQRVTLTTGALTAGAWLFSIGCDLRDAAQTSTPAQTIYVWGAQLEQGAFPTSYIPTTAAAVTRAVDVATMPVAAWYDQTKGSLQFEWMLEGYPVNYGAPIQFVGVNPNTDYIDCDELSVAEGAPTLASLVGAGVTVGGTNLASIQYSASGANFPKIPAGTVQKGATSWAPGLAMGGAHAGVLAPLIAGTVTATPVVTALTIAGGMHYQAGPSIWARHARYWPRVLSNSELQSVTT